MVPKPAAPRLATVTPHAAAAPPNTAHCFPLPACYIRPCTTLINPVQNCYGSRRYRVLKARRSFCAHRARPRREGGPTLSRALVGGWQRSPTWLRHPTLGRFWRPTGFEGIVVEDTGAKYVAADITVMIEKAEKRRSCRRSGYTY